MFTEMHPEFIWAALLNMYSRSKMDVLLAAYGNVIAQTGVITERETYMMGNELTGFPIQRKYII